MKKKKQSKADKAFIAKIKSLGINTGAKSPAPKMPKCAGCGETMVPVMVASVRVQKQKPRSSGDEQSFAM
jgi:hypothetical protein